MSGRILSERYELGELLGKGGMGAVYRARDRLLDRDVAVKLIDSRDRAQSLGEARRTAAVRNPCVIEIFDVGEDGDETFLVMELLEGETLQDRLDRCARLPPRLALMMAARICEALSALHAAAIVHRDVKPSNVFLVASTDADRELQVKLLDFGIARRPHGITQSPETAGEISGTVGFMAPEQIRGEPTDGRADLYALGVVLYTCLAGERPFTATNFAQIIHEHLEKPPPALDVEGVSPAVEAVVVRLLAKAPRDRPADAPQARQMLLDALEGSPPSLAYRGKRELELPTLEEGPSLELATIPRMRPDLRSFGPSAVAPTESGATSHSRELGRPGGVLAAIPQEVSKRIAAYSAIALVLDVVFFHASVGALVAFSVMMGIGVVAYVSNQRRP